MYSLFPVRLLDILDLLTNLLDFCLQIDSRVRYGKIIVFRQDGVLLTVHLLCHEIHLTSHALVLIQDLSHSVDVASKTYRLLIIADLI